MILSKVKTDKNRGSRRWVEEGVTGGDGRSGDAADEERRWSEVNEEERSVGSMFGERERERESAWDIIGNFWNSKRGKIFFYSVLSLESVYLRLL